MAATKVWKRFQKIEKGLLILLCAGMLLTLGIGGGVVFGSCDSTAEAGAATIDGEKITVDPAAYRQFQNRQFRFIRVLQESRRMRGEIKNEEIERRFLMHLLAKDAGILVTDESIRGFIQEYPFFRWNLEEGRFNQDRYGELLRASGTSERDFEMAVREHLEIQQYISNYGYALGPTREEIFGIYKARNKKYSVEYTWQSLEPFEAQVDKDAFTPEEIEKHYDEIKSQFQMPPRWKVESAFIVLSEVPDEEFAAFYEKIIADEELQERYRKLSRSKDASLKVGWKDGWNYWLRNDGVFSETARRTLEKGPDKGADDDADDDEAGETGEEEAGSKDEGSDAPAPAEDGDDDGDGHGDEAGDVEAEAPPVEGEAQPVEGEPPPAGGGSESTEPVAEETAPAAGEIAEPELTRKERYRTYWTGFVRKELFYRRLAQLLAAEARKSETPLEELAEKYGFRLHRTELVSAEELRSLPSIGSPKLREVVMTVTPGESKVLPQVLPLTALDAEILERGWQVVRVVEAKAKEPKPREEIDTEVRDRLFEKKVRDMGRKALEELKEAGEKPEADFAALVAEKGLPLRKLEAFNSNSPRPSAMQSDLESEDEAVRDAARQRALDARVMSRGLSDVRALGGNKTISNPLIDPRTKSVLLIHLLGREDPGPEEMSAEEVDRIRSDLRRSEFERLGRGPISLEKLRESLSWEAPTYGEGDE